MIDTYGRPTVIAAFLSALVLLLVIFTTGCGQDNGQTGSDDPPPAHKPLLRDEDFFGINTGPSDMFHATVASHLSLDNLSQFSFEAKVKVMQTASSTGTAGFIFLANGENTGYNFGIYPNEDRWKLFDNAGRKYVANEFEPGLFELNKWYTLKVEAQGGRLHIFIDGVRKSPPEGFPQSVASGTAGIRVRDAKALFGGMTATGNNGERLQIDDSSFDAGWTSPETEAWSDTVDEGSGVIRGSSLLEVDRLISPELSPEMNTHFDLMEAAGIKNIRVFFRWDEIQPEGPENFVWLYTDAMMLAAKKHHMRVFPSVVNSPNWAIDPQNRTDEASYAFPPQNMADFTRFVDEVVRRYEPGGSLAREQGWDDGFGADTYEIGHEFNVGRIKPEERLLFAGWIGSLDQYLDLLKAGHDAVKEACPDCKVLSGAVADDTPPAYPTNRRSSTTMLQTAWQGLEDLYERISQRHPGDPNASDQYFDILNMHTYQWFMHTAQGQLPDNFRSYAFPDPLWYSDRFANVSAVMGRYGDADKDIWLTETAYSSADDGKPFAGYLSEYWQARALEMVFAQASAFPQVKKVFWWYSFDLDYSVGIIRRDLSPKPSWEAFGHLTGYLNKLPNSDNMSTSNTVDGARTP